MKEVWRYIRGFDKMYQISNFGRVKSKKRKFVREDRLLSQRQVSCRLYVDLKKSNGKHSPKSVSKLVLLHFKKKELGKDYSLHLNRNQLDNKSRNLKWSTLGDIKRYIYETRKKKRGVYYFKNGNKNWRAVIKVDNLTKTIGYFENKSEAEFIYKTTYELIYGRKPY